MDAIALVAYAEQLLPRGKTAVCCILPRGIVWTPLYDVMSLMSYVASDTWAEAFSYLTFLIVIKLSTQHNTAVKFPCVKIFIFYDMVGWSCMIW